MRSAGGSRKIGMTGLTSLACPLRLKQGGRPSASHPVIFPLFIRDTNEGIGMTGFEPATSWSQTRRTTKLCYIPRFLVRSRPTLDGK